MNISFGGWGKSETHGLWRVFHFPARTVRWVDVRRCRARIWRFKSQQPAHHRAAAVQNNSRFMRWEFRHVLDTTAPCEIFGTTQRRCFKRSVDAADAAIWRRRSRRLHRAPVHTVSTGQNRSRCRKQPTVIISADHFSSAAPMARHANPAPKRLRLRGGCVTQQRAGRARARRFITPYRASARHRATTQ